MAEPVDRPLDAVLDRHLRATSRTFALNIPLLPEPLAFEVGLAYLLFRVADTLEDAAGWTPARRTAELQAFRDLVRDAGGDPEALGRRWHAEGATDHAGYRDLLLDCGTVFGALEQVPEPRRGIVRRALTESAAGMASFQHRVAVDGGPPVRTLADLRRYCYFVAGLVGEMLTSMLLDACRALRPWEADLSQRAAAFGEGLQLVNVLKDRLADAADGRCWIPPGVTAAEVHALARDDLGVARDFVAVLDTAGAPRGVRAFHGLPVLLASATLERLGQEGPGARLTRAEVAAQVAAMNDRLDLGQPTCP